MYSNNFYNEFKKDNHSQNGEDGIIEELLNRLQIKSGWVCEFGAWDGIVGSNCRKLTEEGWTGIFIEADNRELAAQQILLMKK